MTINKKRFTKAWQLALAMTACVSINSALAAPIPYLNGLGISGGATSHGDTLSSDTTFRRGPGDTKQVPQLMPLAAACPNIMTLSDDKVMATCVDFFSRQPKVFLFSAEGRRLATLNLSSGTLLGSVYAYADRNDDVLFVNQDNDLLTISAQEDGFGRWTLTIKDKIPLAEAVTGHCGGANCDGVVALNPGSSPNDVWFATQNGMVGIVNRESGKLIYKKLSGNEEITNSFSTALDDVASIATNEALYLLVKEGDNIKTQWRNPYDKGIGRKPGQLSWGTGATPSLFGSVRSDDYVTILDNASPLSNLLIYRAGLGPDSGKLICKMPVLSFNNSGSEDSAIAYNNSVVVNSTYGYPYPQLPRNAGPSYPETAPFIGGMTRIDVNETGTGCETKWVNTIRSAALPKLSIADNLIYTVERTGPFNDASALDTYHFITLDFDTGKKTSSTFFGFGLLSDPLQTAGNIHADGSYWQGMMNGIVRMRP